MGKRLYRSTMNRLLGGVCGGLGEYFDVDPVLIRIVVVLLMLAPGIGVWAYLAAWIIIPKRSVGLAPESAAPSPGSWPKYLPGLVMVMLGALLLIRQHWYWFGWHELWPVVLIVIGVAVIVRGSHGADQSSPAVQPPNQAGLEHSNGGYL